MLVGDHVPTPPLFRQVTSRTRPDNTLELHSLLRLDIEGRQIRARQRTRYAACECVSSRQCAPLVDVPGLRVHLCEEVLDGCLVLLRP